jgi:hypothetical protein
MQLGEPIKISPLSDKQTVNAGIILSIVVCIAIVLLGASQSQFTLATSPTNDPFFYEWQLANHTALGQLTAWLGFALHNLLIWATILYAKRHYTKYTNTLRPANLWALGINVVFIALHYIQTAIFYDGLAQDIPSWTAQFAVALMLIVILAMDAPRRGLFFGKKVGFRKAFIDFLKAYHGYFFSFAVIYTFWFHPMVPTVGHLVGFVHVILVIIQGTVMFTRVHLERKWMLLLELMVLPHSFQVALTQGNALWPMFLFGFASIFLVTQMHGIGLKTWVKRIFYAAFIVAVLYVYFFMRKPYQINEIIRIPMIEYGVVFVMYGLFLVGAWIAGRVKAFRGPEESQALTTGSGD